MSKSAQKLFCNAQNRAGVKRKIKIQVVELKYSRAMENKFLGIRTSQKKFYDKKVCLACALLFVAKRAGSKKTLRVVRVAKKEFLKRQP